MTDEPKQPTPPPRETPADGTTSEPQPPAFDPDYDLITDMERGTKHDVSKREDRPGRQ
jgi:hypothetical protein